MPSEQPIQTYAEFVSATSVTRKFREMIRNVAIRILSHNPLKETGKGWVRFPYYHHIFDDECEGFEQQLRFFANHGDVISIDDAISLIENPAVINGQYFCITFDDGFKNWIKNAVPILVSHKMVAAFFVATDYIGLDIVSDRERVLEFFSDEKKLIEFLNWRDCAAIIDAGMTIGSHTASHKNLMQLSLKEVATELKSSKLLIEKKTNKPCKHFCCPFGRAGIHYLPERHPLMAADAGYQSFLTGHRGVNLGGTSPYHIRRDHLLANWGHHQLRYFLL